jgi:GNAT superfamily N-acetyltransferase
MESLTKSYSSSRGFNSQLRTQIHIYRDQITMIYRNLFFLLSILSHSIGFNCVLYRHKSLRYSELYLAPLSKFQHQLSSFEEEIIISRPESLYQDQNEKYIIGVLEEPDISDTARFVVESFGAEAITLSQDLGDIERALLSPTVGLVNAYSGIVAYAEVLTGIQSRTKDRKGDLSPPYLSGNRDEMLRMAERSSLILLIAKECPNTDWHIDIIASVELRLQPTDAKIPFSFPWLDQLERKLASSTSTLTTATSDTMLDLQPYLCNLCVKQSFRRRKLGLRLVRCVEHIAKNVWGYQKIYLHVDLENTAALKLYQNEGYSDAKRRWKPFWAGKAAEIGYFVKSL